MVNILNVNGPTWYSNKRWQNGDQIRFRPVAGGSERKIQQVTHKFISSYYFLHKRILNFMAYMCITRSEKLLRNREIHQIRCGCLFLCFTFRAVSLLTMWVSLWETFAESRSTPDSMWVSFCLFYFSGRFHYWLCEFLCYRPFQINFVDFGVVHNFVVAAVLSNSLFNPDRCCRLNTNISNVTWTNHLN